MPRATPYEYSFLVANNYNNERTQTALEYTIKITTTTNLPLEFSVHKDGENTELITSSVEQRDSDQTYFRYITVQGDEFGYTQNQQNIYKLEILFSDDYDDADYEGIIEYIQLTIESKQKVTAGNGNNVIDGNNVVNTNNTI